MFASLALGTRFRAAWVFAGVAAAFLIHVCIAVAAGSALGLLPRRVVESLVAALFLAGGIYMATRREEESADPPASDTLTAETVPKTGPSFRRVAFTSFGVVFAGEWGDITQIAIANYAARYDDPISVGIGGTLGLWAAAALAVTAGSKLLTRLPVLWVNRVTGAILLGFGVVSAVRAVTG
ncbi:MAG: TMEM165/GDT1 family protein [Acidothermus sp.]|nr:TMEM165/GDT1 family protein [Acidothermus sp.]